MSFPQLISAPVGFDGANRPEDIRLVEDLLSANHGYQLRYQYDDRNTPGFINPAVVGAIEDFQRGADLPCTGRINPPPPWVDGMKTHPDRVTWELLVRPPLVPLPGVGFGYYYYGNPERRFGTSLTITTLEAVAERFFFNIKAYELSIPGGRPHLEIGIGDMSLAKGGAIYKPDGARLAHGGHRWGTEVDIRPFRKDGQKTGISIVDTRQYDQRATTILVQTLRAHPNVGKILFNDATIRNQVPNVRWATGHDDHLHVYMLDHTV